MINIKGEISGIENNKTVRKISATATGSLRVKWMNLRRTQGAGTPLSPEPTVTVSALTQLLLEPVLALPQGTGRLPCPA